MSNPIELQVARLSGFGRGKTERFTVAEITLGTDPGCHLRFDPVWDKTVNARHARLIRQGDDWVLEATGETRIQGRRVQREVIQPGTTLELGEMGPKIRVEWQPAPVRSSTPPVDSHASRSMPVASDGKSPAGRAPASPETDDRKGHGPWWALAAGGVLLASVAGGGWWWWRGRPEPVVPALVNVVPAAPVAPVPASPPVPTLDTDERLFQAARENEQAVALVVAVSNKDGQPRVMPMATAWAVGDSVLASNAHVTEPIGLLLAAGGSAFVYINKQPDLRFRVTRAVTHPKYTDSQLNSEGRKPAIHSYDVGLLHVEGILPAKFRVAPLSELRQLDSGYRVAFLGFPMENLVSNGVDHRRPVANMQSGIVTSMTDFWLSKATFEESLLVQHNLPATGGASGSPVFNAKGEVVAILSAGNVVGIFRVQGNAVTIQRTPSAALINFAQRIDCLRDIAPELFR